MWRLAAHAQASAERKRAWRAQRRALSVYRRDTAILLALEIRALHVDSDAMLS